MDFRPRASASSRPYRLAAKTDRIDSLVLAEFSEAHRSRAADDHLMLHWLTGTANSAACIYYEHAHARVELPISGVPTGVAVFAEDLAIGACAEQSNRIMHRSELTAAATSPLSKSPNGSRATSRPSSPLGAPHGHHRPGARRRPRRLGRGTRPQLLREAGHDRYAITLTGTDDRADSTTPASTSPPG